MNDYKNAILYFIKSFFNKKKNLFNEKTLNIADRKKISELRNIGIPKDGRNIESVIKEMMDNIYHYGLHANHPRSFSFIPCPTTMVSLLGDIMTSAYNLQAGTWITSSAASCIENELINWLCTQIGYSSKSSGLFVSGGSMANLTALTIARDTILTEETFDLGVAYISDQTHYSISKGLHIIGFPTTRIRKIPTDNLFQMDIQQLKASIKEDISNGLIPCIIIASAGTTNTGSIDPIKDIAYISDQYNIWMHVDGAYGASVILSKKYKYLLEGIEKADSLSWDAHKWLFQSFGCGLILVKDKSNLINTFHTNPEYLKDAKIDDQVNYLDMGIELTRPARGLKLWTTFQIMGSDAIGKSIEHGFYLAKFAENELKQYNDWEIISHAQLAIINFRFTPKSITESQKDEINHKISRAIIEDGYADVFTTELNGNTVLRMCSINPDTTENDIITTICLLNEYAQKYLIELISNS